VRERRGRLIAAAIDVLKEKGFHAAPVRDMRTKRARPPRPRTSRCSRCARPRGVWPK
jgi:hypothetical protein